MKNSQIAAQIVSNLKPGTVVESLRKYHVGERATVAELRGKRVYFTDGQFEDMRSMFNYRIV